MALSCKNTLVLLREVLVGVTRGSLKGLWGIKVGMGCAIKISFEHRFCICKNNLFRKTYTFEMVHLDDSFISSEFFLLHVMLPPVWWCIFGVRGKWSIVSDVTHFPGAVARGSAMVRSPRSEKRFWCGMWRENSAVARKLLTMKHSRFQFIIKHLIFNMLLAHRRDSRL